MDSWTCHTGQVITGGDRRRRLGKLVRRRRESMELTVGDVYERTGLSPTTLKRIEDGLAVRGLSYSRLEPGLIWPKGACRTYLDGGDEPPMGAADPAPLDSEPGDATPEEHIELLYRWADADDSLSDEARSEFKTLIRLAEERISKRPKPRRKRA